MKVRLTESNKYFIETLSDEDKAKVIISDNTIESSDETMHDKLLAYHKVRLAEMGARLKAKTDQLRIDHPEYFESEAGPADLAELLEVN
jgi:hypothetical protein